MLTISVKTKGPDTPAPLTEDDDTRLVEHGCHPAEPVKVLKDWQSETHCLICGRTSSGDAA
jgi:hypothetical protein